MKKLLFACLMLVATHISVQAQKNVLFILPFATQIDPHRVEVDKIIQDSLVASGFNVHVKSWLDITTNFDVSPYDVALLSESEASSTIAEFGPFTAEIPTVSLKSYAMKKGDWTWISLDRFSAFSLNTDPNNAQGCTEMEVAVDHEIFGDRYKIGDRFSFSTGYYQPIAHIQTFDFENSPIGDIENAATTLATSVWAAEGPYAADYATTDIFHAIEENATSKRCVAWGIHLYYVGQYASADFWYLLKNSLRWAVKTPPLNVITHTENIRAATPFTIAPNPTRGLSTISSNFAEAATVNVAITNMLGGKVFNCDFAIAPGEQTMQLDLGALPTGVYVVNLLANGKLQSQKLIIEQGL